MDEVCNTQTKALIFLDVMQNRIHLLCYYVLKNRKQRTTQVEWINGKIVNDIIQQLQFSLRLMQKYFQ